MTRTCQRIIHPSRQAWSRSLAGAVSAGLLLGILGVWTGRGESAGKADPFAAQGFVRFQHPPKAPDFTLLDHAGTPQRLRDFRGQAVLLVFWTTW